MSSERDERQFQSMIDALLRLRWAFEALDLGPPAAIHLRKAEEGRRFEMWLMTQKSLLNYISSAPGARVVAFDGNLWRYVEICGVHIRWPARYDALEGGGIRIA